MPATATSVVAAVSLLFVVYVVFAIVSRGVPKHKDSEIEVGLFPPKIRRKITASGQASEQSNTGNKT
jgi:hypothetical protein